jgi:calcium binding protein 39
MPFFKPNPKTPQELVRSVREAFATLEKEGSGKKADKALEEVSKSLSAMKTMLYGTADQEPQTELIAQLAQEIYNSHLLLLLINGLEKLDFEV